MFLIITKLGEFLLPISPGIVNGLRSYIKHSKDISKLVTKKNSVAPRFFKPLLGVWKSDETRFFVFDILHCVRNEDLSLNDQP